MLLVLAHDQVVGLKQEALDDLEGVAAPVDEVAHIVSGEEGLGFGRPDVLYLGDIDKLLGVGQVTGHGARHDLLHRFLLDVVDGLEANGVGVLGSNKKVR